MNIVVLFCGIMASFIATSSAYPMVMYQDLDVFDIDLADTMAISGPLLGSYGSRGINLRNSQQINRMSGNYRRNNIIDNNYQQNHILNSKLQRNNIIDNTFQRTNTIDSNLQRSNRIRSNTQRNRVNIIDRNNLRNYIIVNNRRDNNYQRQNRIERFVPKDNYRFNRIPNLQLPMNLY